MGERPPVTDILDWIKSRGYYADQISHHRVVDGREAITEDISIDAPVALALSQLGIDGLYRHQVEAIEAVRDGNHLVIATPTASGKTLTYVVPALERAIQDSGKTLYIAPYKALINDQQETFESFAEEVGFDARVDVGVQTGDTPDAERRRIKTQQPDILLLTLDQVHYSLLPYAHSPKTWRWLFEQLETVVIDEVHKYRGVFGSHASLVLRRLNRLCEYYGTSPQYICCSATIGNPVNHAASVTGRDPDSFALVDDDASASGDRHWVFWNPPVKDEDDSRDERTQQHQNRGQAQTQSTDGGSRVTVSPAKSPTAPQDQQQSDSPTTDSTANSTAGGERLSNHAQTVRLFADLVGKSYQTLVFTTARQGAEQYVEWSDAILRERGQTDLADNIHAYHAALKDDDRRQIEADLQDGTARGIWSTKALELGVDIGTLDVVLLDGYPGTSMATFQRAGRAGRGQNECLVGLVASDNPLDQYLLKEPEQLFEDGAERAAVNPENTEILPDHVCCAADELAIRPDDDTHFGPNLPEVVTALEGTDRLRRVNSDQIKWATDEDNPQWETAIRSIDDRQITLIDRSRDEEIATLEFAAALRDAHPDAIYHHQKDTYRVAELDLDTDRAYLSPVNTTEYTRAMREKDIQLHDTYTSETLDLGETSLQATLANMTVSSRITSYLLFNSPRDDNPIEREFDDPLPPHTITTTGLFFEVPEEVEQRMLAPLEGTDPYLAALHALEHALISLLPMDVLCDRRDIGGLSILSHPQTINGTVFVHDAHPGGAGLCREAFDRLGSLLGRTKQLIESCGCTDGCPSCVHSPHCGNANRALDKTQAARLLRQLVSDEDLVEAAGESYPTD